MRFWQAVVTATLAAEFVRTNMHTDWPWWMHAISDAGHILVSGVVWLCWKWVFRPKDENDRDRRLLRCLSGKGEGPTWDSKGCV